MSTAQAIPLTFRLSPLPTNAMTPQQFADAMVARLTAESANTISFFAAGSVAPTSNVGPWLKNNTTWYVWSDSLGMYVPQTIDQSALGYIAQQAPGPDHTAYQFWIQLDGSGKGQSIQYYFSGAWHDIYEDRFATVPTIASMNAAIAAAIGTGVRAYPCAADEDGVPQSVPINGLDVKIVLADGYINPDGAFSNTTSRYTAPVAGIYRVSVFAQVDNATGTPSGMQILLNVFKNGAFIEGTGYSSASPPGSRWWPSWTALIQLAANDYVEVFANCTDGVNTGNVTFTTTTFSIELVQ